MMSLYDDDSYDDSSDAPAAYVISSALALTVALQDAPRPSSSTGRKPQILRGRKPSTGFPSQCSFVHIFSVSRQQGRLMCK